MNDYGVGSEHRTQEPRRIERWLVPWCIGLGFTCFGVLVLLPMLPVSHPFSRTAASLTYAKHETLAAIMYAADYDDYLPLGTAWHTGKDQMCFPMPVGCFTTWAWSISPYATSATLILDATAPPPMDHGKSQVAYDTFIPSFGYNYNYLSPAKDDRGRQKLLAISQVAATSPAQTVMLASKWTAADDKSPYCWATAFPGGMVISAGIESPRSSSTHPDGWGTGGFFDQGDYNRGLPVPVREGRYTGGVAFRNRDGTTTVGYLDGHSRKRSAADLAIGTNWKPGIAAKEVVVTDSTRYLWNVTK